MAGDLILMIEDNPTNRKLIRDVLQFNGYTIREADNAEDGISLARELRPRLILMDLHLPGDGRDRGPEAAPGRRDDEGDSGHGPDSLGHGSRTEADC